VHQASGVPEFTWVEYYDESGAEDFVNERRSSVEKQLDETPS